MSKNDSTNFKIIFRTLKYRNYKLYFTGQSISLIGTWLQTIALSWLVYRMTGSAFTLGLVGFFNRIPTFVFSPFAGVFADRLNKYKLLFLTQSMALLQATLLTILVFTNTIQVWQIFVLSLAGGVINSFDLPIRQSFLIEMIENKEDLSNAIALNSVLVNIARMLGPSIAGVLVAVFGEGWCFLINAVSFLAIIASLMAMKISYKRIIKVQDGVFKELSEGFRYAFGFPPIRSLLLLLALVSLMGMPYQVLMPVFAKKILHGGVHSLGFLMSSAGIGTLGGAFYLASRKTVRGLVKILAFAAGLFGTGLLFFSMSKALWLSMICLVIVGFGMMVQMAGSNTIIQTIVDDDKRGRIMSFYTMSLMGMVPFGNLLAGSLADKLGVSFTVLFGGVSCILASIYFSIRLPVLRKYIYPIYLKKGIIEDTIQIT